jgi:hypothetical protein
MALHTLMAFQTRPKDPFPQCGNARLYSTPR